MPASALPKTHVDRLLLPEARFWQRYSSHYELPLAGMTSLFLHGLVLTALVVSAITFVMARNEASRPPNMDVVKMDQGDGLQEGAGAAPGLPGESGDDKAMSPFNPEFAKSLPEITPTPELNSVARNALNIPAELPSPNDTTQQFDKILQEAKKQTETKAQPNPTSILKKPNPKGEGGRGGSGGGTGLGNKGTGTGRGTPGGEAMTRAQVLAWRWRFDLVDTEGNGKEHADKLATIGMTIAFPNQKGDWQIVQDLRRRPVELKRESPEKFKDAVKWQNTQPQSIAALTRELQLPFTPTMIIMMLPKDREEKIAQEEARYAQQQRRNVLAVRATHFDFQLRNGSYEPVVVRQE